MPGAATSVVHNLHVTILTQLSHKENSRTLAWRIWVLPFSSRLLCCWERALAAFNQAVCGVATVRFTWWI